MKKITLLEAKSLLLKNDNFHILTHRYPDGDTLGCAFALCYALRDMGKKANVIINGKLPSKFSYLAFANINNQPMQLHPIFFSSIYLNQFVFNTFSCIKVGNCSQNPLNI